MRHYFNIDPDGSLLHNDVWRRKTELIIALISVGFSIAIVLLYSGGVELSNTSRHTALVKSLILTFPFICLARLIYVRVSTPAKWFSWLSPAIDIIILSSIIYAFSWQYGFEAASFNAPTFGFYFVMIALHSMRFKPKHTMFCGILAALCWGAMITSFKLEGAATTHSYAEFIISPKLLLGAEIERIIALLTFAGFLAVGAQRARKLMDHEKDMEIEVAKINHQANISQVQFEEMQKTSKMKSDFLDTMSHEMRTPMNGVIGMIQVLEQTELTEKQRYMLSVMDKSSEDMLKIIQDILDFATLNGDGISIESEAFNFCDVLKSSLSDIKQAAEDKGLDVLIQIDPSLPKTLYGDAHYFALIVEKLTSNAVKFTDKGYIRLHIEDKRQDLTSMQNGHIRVTVQDTGIGMSDADKTAIFQAFSQADTSKSRTYGGMGIGLSLVQKLIQAMNSEIRLNSTLGKGTEISFDLTWPHAQPGSTPPLTDPIDLPKQAAPLVSPMVENTPAGDPETIAPPPPNEIISEEILPPPPEETDNDSLDIDSFNDLADILNELNKDESFKPKPLSSPSQKKSA